MKKERELKQNEPSPAAQRRCATPGCGRPVAEAWERTASLCPGCALGLELYDRGERRERIFAGTQ